MCVVVGACVCVRERDRERERERKKQRKREKKRQTDRQNARMQASERLGHRETLCVIDERISPFSLPWRAAHIVPAWN